MFMLGDIGFRVEGDIPIFLKKLQKIIHSPTKIAQTQFYSFFLSKFNTVSNNITTCVLKSCATPHPS